MAARFSAWVKKRPVLAFYLLAFGITWLGWLPQTAYSHGLFPFDSVVFYILGGVGPLLAVFIVMGCLRGNTDFGEIFQPYLRWRVSVGWYLVALFGYAALWLAALAWRGEVREGLAVVQPSFGLVLIFLQSFLAAVPEQVAWRWFALRRLQSRSNALIASLIIGVLWALWHLPLLLNANSVMSTYPLIPYLVEVVAVSVIYTWMFNSTRGSLLIVTLFHAASNTVGPFAGLEQTVVFVAAAVVIVAMFGAKCLSRSGEKEEVREPAAAAAGSTI